MTDKTKTPRELAPGRAIDKLRALDAETKTWTEKQLIIASDRVHIAAGARKAKRRDAILARVHPSAREGVMREAGLGEAAIARMMGKQ